MNEYSETRNLESIHSLINLLMQNQHSFIYLQREHCHLELLNIYISLINQPCFSADHGPRIFDIQYQIRLGTTQIYVFRTL